MLIGGTRPPKKDDKSSKVKLRNDAQIKYTNNLYFFAPFVLKKSLIIST